MPFDYDASAELYMPKRKRGARQPLVYRRFVTAADAIRFAVEELPPGNAFGPWMQVGDERFSTDEIQHLYDSSSYPRRRRFPANRSEKHVGRSSRAHNR